MTSGADEPLFGGYDPPHAPPADQPKVSADRRRTLRQRNQIEAGTHPLTGGRIHPEASKEVQPRTPGKDRPFTCGSCVYREPGGPRGYPKCVLPDDRGRATRVTGGPATDVRAWWPACPAYVPRDGDA